MKVKIIVSIKALKALKAPNSDTLKLHHLIQLGKKYLTSACVYFLINFTLLICVIVHCVQTVCIILYYFRILRHGFDDFCTICLYDNIKQYIIVPKHRKMYT